MDIQYPVMVTFPYAYMTYIVSPLAGLDGGISWRPPTLQLVCEVFVKVDKSELS